MCLEESGGRARRAGGGPFGFARGKAARIGSKASWLLGVVVCLALWGGVAWAQEKGWESAIAAGKSALRAGQYAEAEKMFLAALEEAEKLGSEDPRLAMSLENLANLYRVRGRYAAAEPLYRRLLVIREQTMGPEHPYLATSLNILGKLYHAQGKYRTAEPLYRRALAIVEKA
ncbi:MAG: tetratricopeptide repeat protein, partial [Acidobacteriota bacterium]